MADLKISQLTAISVLTPATDVLPVVDVGGVTKKITTNQILGSGGVATLASATITGAATVGTTLGVTGALSASSLALSGASAGFTATASSGNSLNQISRPTNVTAGGIQFKTSSTNDWILGLRETGDSDFHLLSYGPTADVLTVARLTGNVTISTGNVVMATSGKGIDFTAKTPDGSGTVGSEVLNDYEEGTWTIGLTFGGGNTGLTTALNTGRYTKIGRQVTVCGRLELSNKGSSTGAAVITGLPFSIGSGNDSQQAASFRCNGVSYTGAFQGYGTTSSTTIPLEQISEAGANTDLTNSNFVNGTSIQISLTYTV